MKKIITVLCISILTSAYAFSQITFSVKPGMNLNGANIGYQLGKLKPYLGYQLYGFSSYEKRISGVTTSEQIVALNASMPFIGVKYDLVKNENLATSINLTFFKPIIHGRSVNDGEGDDSFKEEINKFSVWGAELGFSSEYFFDEHFSIGGEFGFRYGKYRIKDENIAADRIDIQRYLFNTTYTSLSLNFYY